MGVTRRTVLRTLAAGGVAAAGTTTAVGQASAIELDCALSGELFEPSGDVTSRDVTIASFDGTELAATVYEPDTAGPHPSVLTTHGWGLNKDLMRCTAQMYASHGYVVLAYDSRGFGDSDGEVQVNGPNEVRDVSALLDWLADYDEVRADGDNPAVGMDGGSYGGGIQLLAAAQDDRIDAIVPRIAWNDLVYSGAPNETIKSGWLGALVGSGAVTSRFTGNIEQTLDERLPEWYGEALEANALPADAESYFEARSPATYLDDLDAPTLVVSGWKDTLFPPSEAVANYRQASAVGVDARLVIYNGGHNIAELGVGDDQQTYMHEAALEWMNAHVRGDGDPDIPEVSLYDEQQETWRTFEGFGDGAEPVAVSLDSLADDRSTVRQAPLWASRTADYDIGSDGAFEVFGTPELTLTVETDNDVLNLFVSFSHVDRWGRSEQIDDQVTAVRIEDGTQTVALELEPLQRSVPDGETLRLEIAAEDPFYLDEYGSATVHNDGSTLELPLADGSL
ncbi:alpha/beta hydrolase fold protein [Natronomonas pharaonis DSM 2160]|uniref:Alpha/beta hydrolase fold protein n=1 Tax=Natronomonas pharaonis (strain ATCC 35678 / DSM 2160 / CIP 103997 / JCM 8858 / NBRC 14720 / NCIMB 2260 / Gabara) TaxID=348780 RepID=A0A1U7EY75_NATPD|nr:CocE/NonD family hydrolase [Natronomonas pharaonis]CAI50173.1 alpha/beta hydrolase fold protein [Natronomonas pharaonis DSM 2160]